PRVVPPARRCWARGPPPASASPGADAPAGTTPTSGGGLGSSARGPGYDAAGAPGWSGPHRSQTGSRARDQNGARPAAGQDALPAPGLPALPRPGSGAPAAGRVAPIAPTAPPHLRLSRDPTS